MQILDESNLPAPDTLIRDARGNVGALMFHYAAAEQNLEYIAHEQGFEIKTLLMTDDPALDEDHVLIKRYEAMEGGIEKDWHPIPPEGWTLGIKLDTEDGPAALFIRRKPAEPR